MEEFVSSLGWLGQVGGWVAAVVLAVGGFRNHRQKETNEALEALLDARTALFEESERKCARDIAELTGRVSTLESAWGEKLAKDIAPEVAKHVATAVSGNVVAAILDTLATFAERRPDERQ